MTKIKNVSAVSAIYANNSHVASDENVSINSHATDNDSIRNKSEKVNPFEQKNSVKFSDGSEEKDSQGRSITTSQAEYFKDSKVRDNNGNLLVLYRSADGGRTMRKKAIKKEASQHGENANALSFTPNATVDTASTNSIRNKSEIVNPSEQKIFALFYVTKKAKGERAKP